MRTLLAILAVPVFFALVGGLYWSGFTLLDILSGTHITIAKIIIAAPFAILVIFAFGILLRLTYEVAKEIIDDNFPK